MKKELGDVAELQQPELISNLGKTVENNKGLVKALGIASFIALATYSAAQLLRDKTLMKKIKDGIRFPKALKQVEELLNTDALKNSKPLAAIKELVEQEEPVAPKKKTGSKKTSLKAAPEPEKEAKPAAKKKIDSPAKKIKSKEAKEKPKTAKKKNS